MNFKRLVSLLILLLSACVPAQVTPVPTPSASPQVISTRLTALLVGTLVDEQGCLRIQSEITPVTYTLVWPPEYTVKRDGSTITMTDGVGKATTWQVGERVHLGGGESGYDDKCPGPYWVVGDVSPGEDKPTPQPGEASSAFPLFPGTQWIYDRDDYAQAPGDPSQLIHGKTQIVETVVNRQEESGYVIVHIKGRRSLLEADPGWAEAHSIDLNDYEYWYVVEPNVIYRSETQPDPAHIQLDQLTEEYAFPMTVGAAWCPQKVNSGDTTMMAETPSPCEFTGKRQIEQAGPYTSPAGSFDRCYQLIDYFNSGNFIRWFCDGVGLVAVKYDHMGTRFGFTQDLIGFRPTSFRPTRGNMVLRRDREV